MRHMQKYVIVTGAASLVFLIMILVSLLDGKPVTFWQGVSNVFGAIAILSFIVEVIALIKQHKQSK